MWSPNSQPIEGPAADRAVSREKKKVRLSNRNKSQSVLPSQLSIHTIVAVCAEYWRGGRNAGQAWGWGQQRRERPPCTVGKSKFFSSLYHPSLPSRKPHMRCIRYHFLLHLFSLCAFSRYPLGPGWATCWSKTKRSQRAVGSGLVGRAGNKPFPSTKFASLNHMPFYQGFPLILESVSRPQLNFEYAIPLPRIPSRIHFFQSSKPTWSFLPSMEPSQTNPALCRLSTPHMHGFGTRNSWYPSLALLLPVSFFIPFSFVYFTLVTFIKWGCWRKNEISP